MKLKVNENYGATERGFLGVPFNFTSLKFSIIRALLSSVFEPIDKTSHMEENVLCKVLGNLRTIFIKIILDLLAKFMSLVTQISIMCYVHVLNLQELRITPSFNMYLVINKFYIWKVYIHLWLC
jgi:hypothetical protein